LPPWRWLLVLRPRRDLLLVLALAAALRLPQLGGTIFLDDQEELLALAHSALVHGALPASGIRASIGTLNFPAFTYLLLPFAALGNPYWAALATALANVAAAGLLYGVTARYAGRRAALAAALLYAAAPWPVYFSRFIWQQNLLAPVVMLFFWTACRGAIERKRGWLPWNLLLWAIAVQLHPSAAPLLALTAVALVVTWRDRRAYTVRPYSWRDGLSAVLALVLPFAPTLLWELATSGSDLALYQAYALRPGVLDGNVLGTLLAVLTPPDPGLFGPATGYARWFGTFGWARVVLVALYAAGIAWMVAALLAARRRHEEWAAPQLPVARLGRPCPMFLLLALLWQAAPLAAMLHHATFIQEHYLLAVMPALFLTIGLFIGWVGERADLAATLAREPLRLAAWWLPNVALVALIAAQALASSTFVASAQAGYASGPQAFHYTRYGIPLDTQQAALDALLHAAHAGGARAEIAATDWGEPGFGYLAAIASQPVSVYDGTRCALAPAPGSESAEVLAMQPLGAADLLAELAGNTGRPALAGQQANPLRLYAIRAGATLPGETPLSAPTPSAGSGVHLTGYRLHVTNDGGARLTLHFSGAPPAPSPSAAALTYWRGALPGVGGVAQYTFTAQPLDATGKPLGPARGTTCSELHWGPGDDLYAWIDLPAKSVTAPGGWRITSARQEYAVSRPHVGPLALESGDLVLGPVERVASGIIPVAPAAS
ncbi:MAG TPA: glycosyltransferase family 39 protein, partial [Ktedonobacterales bacterium]|nr:glycosyltransferase family 39 protein [Ktedonobacterales bacterium]